MVAPPPGLHDELKVRLKRPSGPHLVLVDGGDKPSKLRAGQAGVSKSSEVEIKRAGARRDVRVGGGNTKFVLGPPVR